mmetsp:Transcript_5733/g.10146  ORF Transcript_5733/g.10146 Transcript_5733/m.10146 type:complete len:93 (+) Transcript_5733:1244-1522(+)
MTAETLPVEEAVVVDATVEEAVDAVVAVAVEEDLAVDVVMVDLDAEEVAVVVDVEHHLPLLPRRTAPLLDSLVKRLRLIKQTEEERISQERV